MKISAAEAQEIVSFYRTATTPDLVRRSNEICRTYHGDKVFLRGLIEFSNHCSMDCLYCGIRASNANVHRYRLSVEQIVELAQAGWDAGIRTFVLQGGEDPWFTRARVTQILEGIKKITGDGAAVTMSVGIRSKETYREWKSAGADRYLMRFETSDETLHKHLRNGVTLKRRLQALDDLRICGYEVGSGFMVGLPGETEETRIQNALLCHSLDLHMVGIGPFIPHPETPLKDAPQQPIELAIRATALVRILLPLANMPATTAAGSLDKQGREKMMAAGANVLMPNITPESVKKDYLLYPNKICLDESGFECINCLDIRTHLVDKKLDWARGNSLAKGQAV